MCVQSVEPDYWEQGYCQECGMDEDYCECDEFDEGNEIDD